VSRRIREDEEKQQSRPLIEAAGARSQTLLRAHATDLRGQRGQLLVN
jgi:hypothetical protein